MCELLEEEVRRENVVRWGNAARSGCLGSYSTEAEEKEADLLAAGTGLHAVASEGLM